MEMEKIHYTDFINYCKDTKQTFKLATQHYLFYLRTLLINMYALEILTRVKNATHTVICGKY